MNKFLVLKGKLDMLSNTINIKKESKSEKDTK